MEEWGRSRGLAGYCVGLFKRRGCGGRKLVGWRCCQVWAAGWIKSANALRRDGTGVFMKWISVMGVDAGVVFWCAKVYEAAVFCCSSRQCYLGFLYLKKSLTSFWFMQVCCGVCKTINITCRPMSKCWSMLCNFCRPVMHVLWLVDQFLVLNIRGCAEM